LNPRYSLIPTVGIGPVNEVRLPNILQARLGCEHFDRVEEKPSSERCTQNPLVLTLGEELSSRSVPKLLDKRIEGQPLGLFDQGAYILDITLLDVDKKNDPVLQAIEYSVNEDLVRRL
jgi:hypothetical protein